MDEGHGAGHTRELRLHALRKAVGQEVSSGLSTANQTGQSVEFKFKLFC